MPDSSSKRLTLVLLSLAPAVVLAQARPTPAAQPGGAPGQPAPASAGGQVAANRPDATRPPTSEAGCADGATYVVNSRGQADACLMAPVAGACTGSGAAWEVDKSGHVDQCSKPQLFPVGTTNRSPCGDPQTQVARPGRDECRPSRPPECGRLGMRTGTLLVGPERDTCGPSARCESQPIQLDAEAERDLCFSWTPPRCQSPSALAVDYCKPKLGFRPAGCLPGALGGGTGQGDVCTRSESGTTAVSEASCPAGTRRVARDGQDQCRSQPQPPAVCPPGTRLVARFGPDDCLP